MTCLKQQVRTKGTETLRIKMRRGADASLSPCTLTDRTCRVEMVRHEQGECNRDVMCKTVEQNL